MAIPECIYRKTQRIGRSCCGRTSYSCSHPMIVGKNYPFGSSIYIDPERKCPECQFVTPVSASNDIMIEWTYKEVSSALMGLLERLMRAINIRDSDPLYLALVEVKNGHIEKGYNIIKDYKLKYPDKVCASLSLISDILYCLSESYRNRKSNTSLNQINIIYSDVEKGSTTNVDR